MKTNKNKSVVKNSKNKKSAPAKNKKRVAKVAMLERGRPRAEIEYPRKKRFTVADVLKINELSILTVRKRLAEDAKVVDTIPAEGRGHPTHVFALN